MNWKARAPHLNSRSSSALLRPSSLAASKRPDHFLAVSRQLLMSGFLLVSRQGQGNFACLASESPKIPGELEEDRVRRFHIFIFWMVVASLAATAQQQTAAPAQSSTDDKVAMDQRLRDLEDRIVMLEGEIRQLKAQGTQPAAGTAPAPAAQPTPPAEGGTQQAAAAAP